jgi:hypothetical protein
MVRGSANAKAWRLCLQAVLSQVRGGSISAVLDTVERVRSDAATSRHRIPIQASPARRQSPRPPRFSSIADAVDLLEAGGLDLVEASIHGRSAISDAIRAHAREIELVIVGGDGTFNAAAAGLVETGLPLGILPLGTANDVARTFALPLAPVEAARVVLEGSAWQLDLASISTTTVRPRRYARAGLDRQRTLLRRRHDGEEHRAAGRRSPRRLWLGNPSLDRAPCAAAPAPAGHTWAMEELARLRHH